MDRSRASTHTHTNTHIVCSRVNVYRVNVELGAGHHTHNVAHVQAQSAVSEPDFALTQPSQPLSQPQSLSQIQPLSKQPAFEARGSEVLQARG